MIIISIILIISIVNIGNWVFQLYKRDEKNSSSYALFGIISYAVVVFIEWLLSLGYLDIEKSFEITTINYHIGIGVISIVTILVRCAQCRSRGIFKYNQLCSDITRLEINAASLQEEIADLENKGISSSNSVESYREELKKILDMIDKLRLEKEKSLIEDICKRADKE